MPRIRAFIALPTSNEIKQQITAIQSQLKETHADVRWEGAEKFHITLKFLGDSEPEVLQSLASNLRDSLRETRSFDLLYDALGCFPGASRPRVVWVGAHENPHIASLQQLVEEVCVRTLVPSSSIKSH